MARRNRNSRTKDPAPGWVWMLFGLTLGLVVAAGVYFRAPPRAPQSAAAAPAAPAKTPVTAASGERRQARGAQGGRSAEAAETSEQRFDFYELLPQFEVVVPEVETAAGPAARSQPIVAEPGSYVLQAGSFSALGDADRLKARIALLGIESRIQRVTIDDDVYHRVRIGPISDLDRLNRIRRQLRDAQVDTLLMRIPQ
jgi:cell division protein FtsN